MPEFSNKLIVLGAIAANVLIATAKFIAAAVTGSSAMLAEAIHSVVDTGDGCLLLLGEHLAARPPDDAHPFGHGREIYFWSFLVALVIFGVGGGMSVYQGVSRLLHPVEPTNPLWNYAVLGFAFLFESISWTLSAQAFHKRKPSGQSVWHYLHHSKDPSLYTVLLEDSSDIAGLLIAFLGLLVGQFTGSPYADGIASILIGCLLAAVALFLGFETRGLLLGEATDPDTRRAIRQLAQDDPVVHRADHPLTMYLAPREILLNIAIQFKPNLPLHELEAAINRIETVIRTRHPHIQRIFIEAKTLTQNTPNSPPSP